MSTETNLEMNSLSIAIFMRQENYISSTTNGRFLCNRLQFEFVYSTAAVDETTLSMERPVDEMTRYRVEETTLSIK